ncbi:hypothetical protein V9T40_009502 [Parthenolecanium corni]|uniref:Uncharacterized protein n=1 Tax=Parthenolecanium corni TaxID=536013 RepID=A0AAN9Y7K2_9HEMI
MEKKRGKQDLQRGSTNIPNISDLFSELQLSIQKKSDVSALLNQLVEKLNSGDKVEVTQDVVEQLVAVFQLEKLELSEKVAEIVAALAKQENHREKLSDQKLITKLCLVLQQTNKNNLNFGVVKQTCRALGNLCCENDKSRKCVLLNNGLKTITDTVKLTLPLGNHSKSSELRCCAVGLLLNFVAGYEDLEVKNLRVELLDLLGDLLDCGVASKDDEPAAIHCLIILGVLGDADNEPILNERLCNTLVKILEQSTSGELVELCIELMHSQSEHASVSLNLAKAGLCELLIQLLEKHKNLADDIDTRNLFKMACDLIIIILNDDQSMELLFENGKGRVYQSVVNWLSSSVEELQVSGVLAVVNFARADSHCTEMVKQGISKKLIAILSKNNTDKGDMKLQHALLSALRNLVIPDQNKSIVIKDGLLETLYPMISITSYPVVFKLLGTFRIVIDKQDKVAEELGCKKDLILKVVEWSAADHPGVQGEAVRFLAWLIKNCRSQTLMDVMIECKAVPKLVDMVISDHEVMQNEALLALAILSSVRLSNIEKILIEGKIGEKIVRLIEERKPKKEVFSNVLTVIRQLCSSGPLKQHLQQSNVAISINSILKNENSVIEYQDEVCQVTKLLECG